MRRFDTNIYEASDSLDTSTSSRGVRDPYFERYQMQIYQELAENPSALFNFFYENNDILKRIEPKDHAYLSLVYVDWYNKCNNALWGSFIGVAVLDFFVLRKHVGPKIPSFVKPLYFVAKYAGVPMLSYKLTNDYLNIEQEFLDCAAHYNFGYEDFENALSIFEKAKIANKLDLLLEQRGDFDLKQLDSVELSYSISTKTALE